MVAALVVVVVLVFIDVGSGSGRIEVRGIMVYKGVESLKNHDGLE